MILAALLLTVAVIVWGAPVLVGGALVAYVAVRAHNRANARTRTMYDAIQEKRGRR